MTLPQRRVDRDALVYCPLHGRKLDLEDCLACPRLDQYDLDGRHPWVSCRTAETAATAAVTSEDQNGAPASPSDTLPTARRTTPDAT